MEGGGGLDVALTLLAAEVWKCHVLERDLLQESWPLASWVARDDFAAAEPVAQPCQTAVTVEGVGQQVPGTEKQLGITADCSGPGEDGIFF